MHRVPTIFFFNDTATTEIYTLSLHDALPIFGTSRRDRAGVVVVARVEGPEVIGLSRVDRTRRIRVRHHTLDDRPCTLPSPSRLGLRPRLAQRQRRVPGALHRASGIRGLVVQR